MSILTMALLSITLIEDHMSFGTEGYHEAHKTWFLALVPLTMVL